MSTTTRSKYQFVTCMMYFGLVSKIMCSFPDGYQMAKKLHDEKLGADRYSPDLRPVRNPSDVTTVNISFSLIRVIEIDDVEQKFVANGFVLFCWKDELLTWNPEDYNGTSSLTPHPREVWKPRVILLNTLQLRDPFEDNHSPLLSHHLGALCWAPGALFTVSCYLDMTKYPFDTQICYITMCSMNYFEDKISYYTLRDHAETSFYQSSGEWILVKSTLRALSLKLNTEDNSPCFEVQFHLERRPEFYVTNIILPVVFMSFLNLLVFLIPNESGEKISYGITVLLALAVFMSMVSTMMPRSSDARPKLTTYLFILLTGSVLSVTASIVTVWFHFTFQTLECSYVQTQENKSFDSQTQEFHRSTNGTPTTTVVSFQPQFKVSRKGAKYAEAKQRYPKVWKKVKGDKCKIISKHLDKICFVVFLTFWVAVNVWYVVTVMI